MKHIFLKCARLMPFLEIKKGNQILVKFDFLFAKMYKLLFSKKYQYPNREL